MESLALVVSLILLVVILLGPMALTLSFLGFKVPAVVAGVLALLIGLIWCSSMPFPISLIGGACAIMGAISLNRF